MEAEHDTARRDAGGHAWRDVTFSQGYAGDGAVAAQPDDGTPGAASLDYAIAFQTAGTHHVWIRANAYGRDTADSVTVSLDDGAATTLDLHAPEGFQWAGGVTVEVPDAGEHTLHLT